MGIRFFCPNGHKLNVKEFQAGRRGICPFCGAKIQIPTQSTRPSSRELQQRQRAEAVAEGEEAAPPPMSATPADEIVFDSPAGRELPPADPVVVTPAAATPVPAPAVTPSYSAATAAPSVPPPAPVPPPQKAADPIAEAPEMIWYVRPPSGGQFGPAAGDVMRGWLAEGRVSADSLLWREGWRDWQEAGNVFPQLKAGQSTAFLETAPVVSAVKSPTPIVHHPRSRHRVDGTTVTVIVMVGMAIVILAAVFLMVLFKQ